MDEVTEKIMTAANVGIQIVNYIEKKAKEYGATLDDVVIDCFKYSSSIEEPSHAYVYFRIMKPYGKVNIDFSIDDGIIEMYQKQVT